MHGVQHAASLHQAPSGFFHLSSGVNRICTPAMASGATAAEGQAECKLPVYLRVWTPRVWTAGFLYRVPPGRVDTAAG